jgi:hypothetical protein
MVYFALKYLHLIGATIALALARLARDGSSLWRTRASCLASECLLPGPQSAPPRASSGFVLGAILVAAVSGLTQSS